MLSSKLKLDVTNNKVTDNNIISKEIIRRIIFFLFKIKPSTPIKNRDNEKNIFSILEKKKNNKSRNNSRLLIKKKINQFLKKI